MTIEDFMDNCESGGFINYDGFANELILNDKVVCKETIYPSDALFFKKKILNLVNEHPNLQIVWYNR